MTASSELSGRGAGRLNATASLLAGVPPFSDFERIGDPAAFAPLPDGWVVGLADVVSSTRAIEQGRYKAVNLAGAAVVSAVSNALGTLDFPFLFTGDGASFAVAPSEAAAATEALAATVGWVGEALELELRGASLTVAEIRRHGHDVRVARFAASGEAAYAMFAGGGLRWAEGELKAGRLAPLGPGPMAEPDLTGLSCRFKDIAARHGVILSVLVRPRVTAGDLGFRAVVADVLAAVALSPGAGRPVPVFDKAHSVAPATIALNARLGHAGQARWSRWLRSAARGAMASFLLGSGAAFGRFSARRYLADIAANADFRKYDDGLMMTVDCPLATADLIERRLRDAERDGIVWFGLHRQPAATVTCVVPNASSRNHVHFIDGSAGGYTMASLDLKSRLAREKVV